MDQYLIEAIDKLLPSIIVMISTILGISLTNIANNKKLVHENKFQIIVDNLTIFRNRLEELVLLMYEYEYSLEDFHFSNIKYLQSTIDVNQLRSEIEPKLNKNRDLLVKIEMILVVYFIDIQPNWNEIKRIKNDMMLIVMKKEREGNISQELIEQYIFLRNKIKDV